MSDHSPEAVAAYPYETHRRSNRVTDQLRTAFDRGRQSSLVADRETVAQTLDPEAFEEVTYPGEEAFKGDDLLTYRALRRENKRVRQATAFAQADAVMGVLLSRAESDAQALEAAADKLRDGLFDDESSDEWAENGLRAEAARIRKEDGHV